jgi:hypothetical protein
MADHQEAAAPQLPEPDGIIVVGSQALRAFTAETMLSFRAAGVAEALAKQAAEVERLREAIATAYGHLWHVNNEPMAPVPLRSPEAAAYAARKALRDLLTTNERGAAINRVGQELGRLDAAIASGDPT